METKFAKNEAGFSMMELMAASTIFLVAMGAIFAVLQIGGSMRENINDSSETVNNARMAVNAVGRDAINAGLGYSRVGAIVPDNLAGDLFGVPNDSGSARDLFTSIIAGNEISTSSLSVGSEKNDSLTLLYRDLGFNNGNAVVINDVDYNPNWIDLKTASGECSNCRKWDLYLVESGNGNHALAIANQIRDSNSTIRLHKNNPLDLNRRTDLDAAERSILTPCGTNEVANCFLYAPQATVKKVHLINYRVNSDGTLLRTIYGNNSGQSESEQIREFPLVHNVQHFQVRYLMSDGSFSNDPSNSQDNQGNMNEVVQIEVTVKVRAESETTNTSQVVTLSSTFSTRNLKYDVE